MFRSISLLTTLLFLISLTLLESCSSSASNRNVAPQTEELLQQDQAAIAFPKTVAEIPLPKGFHRSTYGSKEFAHHLLQLPLKDEGTPVMLHNGEAKGNQNVHYAVMDLPIGKKDLHQCADAVMRVRADFLRAQKRYDDLQFHFVSGFNCAYSKWMAGNRVRVSGNQVSWYAGGEAGDSDASYWKYLETVWSYASTLSLEKELHSKAVKDIAPGDVWITGGSPGHAVLVLDVVQNDQGEKRFLLAQSYMPAQEMHVLKNPLDKQLSPWFEIPENQLRTPQWTFELKHLRGW